MNEIGQLSMDVARAVSSRIAGSAVAAALRVVFRPEGIIDVLFVDQVSNGAAAESLQRFRLAELEEQVIARLAPLADAIQAGVEGSLGCRVTEEARFVCFETGEAVVRFRKVSPA